MKKLYLALLLSLPLSITFAQRKMIAIGSSTTAGVGASPIDSSWVNRFNFYYKYQLGILDSTYNLGVGGYTCYKGMPSSYVAPPGREAPDPARNVTQANNFLQSLPVASNGVVIINFPSNGYVDFTIAEIMACLQTMYDSITIKGHRCYITTVQPRTDGAFGSSAMKKKMATIKDSILQRFGTAHTINFWDGLFNPADTTILSQYSAGDNIHLNKDGHKVLFDRVVAKNVFAVTLPVKLKQFKASRRQQQVDVSWTATLDHQPAAFTLQRSSDGVTFQSLQTLRSRNTTGEESFRYTDPSPATGNNYYRLLIEEAGDQSYSQIVLVKNEWAAIQLHRLYPVPVRQTLTVDMSAVQPETLSFTIVGSSGNTLQQFNKTLVKGDQLIALPVHLLPQGNYFLCIQRAGQSSIVQLFSK